MPGAALPFAKALPGRYRVEREVGRGGMATVYLAYDLRHERTVALKVLRPELSTVLAGERFAREIAVAARLNHPHILPLLDSGVVDVHGARPVLYYTMPYVEGQTLRDRLRAEPQLPLTEAVTLASQLAEALEHAHSRGVIHRDVKPENILLANGAAVVADFGIARALDAAGVEKLTETGFALGTPAYMSPEQASGHERVDGRSDQYALACVVYEMLAGQPPFGGPTPQAVLARHAVDPIPPLRTVRPTVPRALERVLERGLAKVPADRYATTGEFARAMHRALAAPAEQHPRPVPRVSRRASLALGAAAVLAFLATVGSAALWNRAPAPRFEPGRVLVAPLEHDPTDSALRRVAGQLASTLPDAIAREGVAEPVPAAMVRDLLARTRGTPGEVAERMARETGSGLQLRGACLRPVAGRASCQVDLLRMPARTLRMSANVTGDPTDSAFAAALSERMLVMLLLQKNDGDQATWRGEYIPRSLAAVRKRSEADDAGDWYRYRELLQADTEWVSAIAVVAVSAAMRGDIGFASAESTLNHLRARPNLLPGEREVLMYWLASLKGDSELAYEMLRRRFSANPRQWSGAAPLFAIATNRPNAALAITALADTLLYADSTGHAVPFAAVFGPRGDALHQLGRYREELQLARELRRRFSGRMVIPTRTMEAMALAALGETDTLRRLIAEWEATPEGVGSAGTRAWVAGQELIAHGHEADGRAMLAGTLPLYRRLRDSTGYASWNEIWVLTWLGRLDEARRLSLAALAKVGSGRDSLGYIGPLGSIAARQGRPDESAKWDRTLVSFDSVLFLGGGVGFFRAQIAAARGDRAQAVRHLEEARSRESYGTYSMPSTYRSVHRWPDFASLRGYPPFEQFLRPRD
jgi:hypothetical protein